MSNSKPNIILVGGGGHCHSVIDVIEQGKHFTIAGIVDLPENVGKHVMGYEVIGCDDDLKDLKKHCQYAVITTGQISSSQLRQRLYQQLENIGFNLPVIISPLAYVAKSAVINDGTVIMHHALVNANASVGKCCIINTKALIEHDAVVEDFCHISTAAVVNGGVRIKTGCFFGSNATSKQAIEVKGFIKAGGLVK